MVARLKQNWDLHTANGSAGGRGWEEGSWFHKLETFLAIFQETPFSILAQSLISNPSPRKLLKGNNANE